MKDGFDIFYLDGFSWTDLLDFLFVPHYSNEHAFDAEGPVRHYHQRRIYVPDYDEEEPEENGQIQTMLVLWEGRDEPTDDEIKARIQKDCE